MEAAQQTITKPNPLIVLADQVIRTVLGKRHLPPLWLRDVGLGDFESTGQEFLDIFVRVGNLQPDEQVLEIGCGCGRMALPLTRYLSKDGSYTGMDITLNPILWCRQEINSRYPNFQFYHIDLYNKRYNPTGQHRTRDYAFPFDAGSFDFIFLTSVFTHLLPEDIENYLREIARLLRPQGRCLATFFLLNETQQTLAGQGKNAIEFKYGSGPYRLRNESIPESAVAYDEDFLRALVAGCDLAVEAPIRYGAWSGRDDGLSFQDILLLQRRFDDT